MDMVDPAADILKKHRPGRCYRWSEIVSGCLLNFVGPIGLHSGYEKALAGPPDDFQCHIIGDFVWREYCLGIGASHVSAAGNDFLALERHGCAEKFYFCA